MILSLALSILFCTFTLSILAHFFSKWKYYKLSFSLPGPIHFPLIGNALSFFCDDEDIFERAVNICSKYCSPMKLWFGPKFVLILTKAEQSAKILSSTNFLKKDDDIYKFIKIFSGEGLISGSGSKWKRDRRLMAPLFIKKCIEEYFTCICRHTGILLEKLENNVEQPTFNIETYIHRWAADVVNESIVGIKTHAQEGKLEKFLKASDKSYDIVHARMVKVWLQVEWIFKLTHYWKEQKNCIQEVHSFLRNAITLIENRRINGISSQESIFEKILAIRDKVPDFASEDELLHHLTTLYSASEDTITTITSFTFLLLGMYPEIQKKVVSEIKKIIGDKNDIELKDLSKMNYLEMCIKDILRLFPIGPFIVRKSEKDFRLDNITIPQGCSVMVSIHNIHRDQRYWEKPDDFHPEHFLPNAVTKRHSYAYMPFSAGPRSCLGKHYALMATKIVLVLVLRKYEIFADGKVGDIKLKADISVRPKGRKFPVRISFRKPAK